jgi:hypothetical protein
MMAGHHPSEGSPGLIVRRAASRSNTRPDRSLETPSAVQNLLQPLDSEPEQETPFPRKTIVWRVLGQPTCGGIERTVQTRVGSEVAPTLSPNASHYPAAVFTPATRNGSWLTAFGALPSDELPVTQAASPAAPGQTPRADGCEWEGIGARLPAARRRRCTGGWPDTRRRRRSGGLRSRHRASAPAVSRCTARRMA